MEIRFTMTPEQIAADEARAREYHRTRVRALSPAELKAELAILTRLQRRPAPVAGPHVSTLTPAEAERELRRLGVRNCR